LKKKGATIMARSMTSFLGSKENPPLGFIPRVKPSVGEGGWLGT